MRAFLFLFCLSVGSLTFAQSRFSFGIDLEAGISGKKDADRHDYITYDEGLLTSSENGRVAGPAFSAGLWADYQVFSFLSVRSGVSFRGLQMGWYSWYEDHRSASPRANDYRHDTQLQAYYLELPTSLRLQLPLSAYPNIRPFVEWGMRPGWFVGGEYAVSQQTGVSKGKATMVSSLDPQQHHDPFGVPTFWGVGVELNRVTVAMTFNQERPVSYGNANYIIWCGVGDPPFFNDHSEEPYINDRDWKRSLMAKISYRLF